MRVTFRPEAERELLQAQAWYEARAVGLGFEFARAIDSVISRIARTPRAFPCITVPFQHVVARRFPYSVIYHFNGTDVLIVAIHHHRRHAGDWSRREPTKDESTP